MEAEKQAHPLVGRRAREVPTVRLCISHNYTFMLKIYTALSSPLRLADRICSPSLIAGVIVTHCHADHDAGTFQKVLLDEQVNIISTRSSEDADHKPSPFYATPQI